MNRLLTFYYQRIKPKFLVNPLHSEISENPFFILSAGRSGSTLLRKLLVENAAINIPPESDDLIPKLVKFYLRNNHRSWHKMVDGCAGIFKSEKATELWDLSFDVEKLKEHCFQDKSLAGIIASFYDLYAKEHSLDNEIWGDKTPFLLFRLRWINMVYPNGKYIFLIRDGRAVVSSYLKMNKGYSVEKAIERWKFSIKIIQNQMHSRPEQCLLIKYEDLVIDTPKVLAQTLNFLGTGITNRKKENIFLGDDILPHHKNIHSDISSSYIDNWRNELNGEEIKIITEKIKKHLKTFNYSI